MSSQNTEGGNTQQAPSSISRSLPSSTPVRSPLAERMRPMRLQDLIGHDQVIGASSPLRKIAQADQLQSIILWGPPGCGKTTVAQALCQNSRSVFKKMSATSAGVKVTNFCVVLRFALALTTVFCFTLGNQGSGLLRARNMEAV
jgi:putative ATPase